MEKMEISVELSLYPLDKDYVGPIVEFISRLKQYRDIEVRENNMSTQVFGDYDQVMTIVQREMKTTMALEPAMVMVLKVLNRRV